MRLYILGDPIRRALLPSVARYSLLATSPNPPHHHPPESIVGCYQAASAAPAGHLFLRRQWPSLRHHGCLPPPPQELPLPQPLQVLPLAPINPAARVLPLLSGSDAPKCSRSECRDCEGLCAAVPAHHLTMLFVVVSLSVISQYYAGLKIVAC